MRFTLRNTLGNVYKRSEDRLWSDKVAAEMYLKQYRETVRRRVEPEQAVRVPKSSNDRPTTVPTTVHAATDDRRRVQTSCTISANPQAFLAFVPFVNVLFRRVVQSTQAAWLCARIAFVGARQNYLQ